VVIFTDMDYQGRYEPQGDRSFANAGKTFFADHRASRRPVEGTIARGQMRDDEGFSTGVTNNTYVGRNPLTIDMPISDSTGRLGLTRTARRATTVQARAAALVGQRAIWIPTNLHEPRVRDMNDGEIFNVITNGRRSMPPYKYQVVDRDRWAIVAYVRALQRATGRNRIDVPEDKSGGTEITGLRMIQHATHVQDSYRIDPALWSRGRNGIAFIALISWIAAIAGYFIDPDPLLSVISRRLSFHDLHSARRHVLSDGDVSQRRSVERDHATRRREHGCHPAVRIDPRYSHFARCPNVVSLGATRRGRSRQPSSS
jgi:hypothetical protein